MSGQSVLITGGTGFLGFRALIFALEAGYRVRVAVRKQEGFERIKSIAPITQYAEQLESVIVPDITTPGAYDEAVQGVDYVIHIASPVPGPAITSDFDKLIVQPAVQGTLTMLEAAYKASGVKKVVITSSVAAIIPLGTVAATPSGTVYNEKSRLENPTDPLDNPFTAYFASKVMALNAAEAWIKEKNPSFDVVHVAPGYLVGRDSLLREPNDFVTGSNGFLMRQLLLGPDPYPVASLIVHVDDAARVHVKALDPSIKGNRLFPVFTQCPEGPDWDDVLEIAKRRYPKQVADGTFKVDAGTKTQHIKADASYTEQTFGFKAMSFEEAAVSLMDQYVELIGKK